jgi:glutamine phosphoribosylpyrophosphate amidotransferase
MCGIFGIVSSGPVNLVELRHLARHAEQRGKDSSGLFISKPHGYDLHRATNAITSLLNDVQVSTAGLIMGHSRLITNGLAECDPRETFLRTRTQLEALLDSLEAVLETAP